MNREKLSDIVDSCPVEYYLSANDSCSVYWPYRMQPVHESSPRYVDNADTYILDSSFNDPGITNKDALDRAVEIGADMVVLEDVYQDFQGTVEKVNEGLEMATEHEFQGSVIAPLQEPYIECWHELNRPNTVAIGGLKDATAEQKVRVAKELRNHTGGDVWIHGLGWGATDTLIHAIRKDPELLDSIDAQTPYASASDGSVWKGKHASVPVAIRSLANLVESCRRMNPAFSKEPDTVKTLEEWQ